eukprot:COSAG03_NODE_9743_length_696_cov_1.596315_2_plen_76_part_00
MMKCVLFTLGNTHAACTERVDALEHAYRASACTAFLTAGVAQSSVWKTPVKIIPTLANAAVSGSPFWMSDAVPTP